ncbi:hypothetical protein UK99_22835 [Frankia casuarinae]|nr:hypothetical protein UK99_22835 [Frankia casuarinae]
MQLVLELSCLGRDGLDDVRPVGSGLAHLLRGCAVAVGAVVKPGLQVRQGALEQATMGVRVSCLASLEEAACPVAQVFRGRAYSFCLVLEG